MPAPPPTYEEIVEGLSDAVIAISSDMEITAFNLSAERLSEISRAQAVGKPIGDVFKVDGWISKLANETVREGKIHKLFEETLQRKFSGPLKVGVSTHRLYDRHGEPCGAALLIKNLSELSAIEAESERMERLAYIGSFSAKLAHEVKNPLSGIRGSAQIIERKATEPSLRQFAEVIVKEADRLNGIVNDLLEFTRTSKLKKTAVNIHELLDKVLLLLGSNGVARSALKDFDPSLPPVLADEDKLTQLFLNIIKNAFEAAGETGGESEVRLVTRIKTGIHISKDTNASEKLAAIEIIDNGPGMPQKVIDEIFTPFFTTKPGGSGLGMGISYNIVKEHNGLLEINSEVNSGTKVSIYLPTALVHLKDQ